MNQAPVQVGLIGIGYVAVRCHLPALARVSGLQLAAVADPLPERRALAQGARHFEHWQDLLADPGLDAVIVATPSDQHAEIGVAALSAGKHLLLEKPIALNTADGIRLRDASAASGRVAAVGLFLRNLRLTQRLRDLVPRLSQPLAGHSAFHNHVVRRRTVTGYERRKATGGGVLFDLAYHHFDLYPWLLGSEIAAVECRTASRETEDDVAVCRTTLANGCLITGSFNSATYNENRIELFGTGGRLSADMYRGLAPRFRPTHEGHVRRLLGEAGEGIAALGVGTNLLPRVKLQPFVTQLERFRDAVQGKKVELPGLEDGLAALRAVEAAYESAATGREVPV